MQLWKASRSQSQGCVVILGMVSFIPSQSGALGVLWADEGPAPTAVLIETMLAKCRAQGNTAGWAEGAGLDLGACEVARGDRIRDRL